MKANPESPGHRTMRRCYLGVVGPGATDSATYDIAREVGRLAVERLAATVVCGGLGGVMEAAARGAAEAGGMSVGFLPGSDRSEANEYLDVKCADRPGGASRRAGGERQRRPGGGGRQLGHLGRGRPGVQAWLTGDVTPRLVGLR